MDINVTGPTSQGKFEVRTSTGHLQVSDTEIEAYGYAAGLATGYNLARSALDTARVVSQPSASAVAEVASRIA